jgi:hypothetical protein
MLSSLAILARSLTNRSDTLRRPLRARYSWDWRRDRGHWRVTSVFGGISWVDWGLGWVLYRFGLDLGLDLSFEVVSISGRALMMIVNQSTYLYITLPKLCILRNLSA